MHATGRSLFVTGASSGIGRATARFFAERGWFLGLHDADESALQLLADEIGLERCIANRLDVRDVNQWKRAMARFSDCTSGRMDVLFQSAGILRMGPLMEVPLAEHFRTLEINTAGVLNGMHCAFPLLAATANSRVISMSSASAFYGTPDQASYSMSKFAIRGLTEALNIEWEKHGIWVCDIMPSYVNTTMVSQQTYKAGSLRFFGAKLTPEYVATIVWKAVHGRRVHWVPTLSLRLTALFARYFPCFERATMRFIDSYAR